MHGWMDEVFVLMGGVFGWMDGCIKYLDGWMMDG